MLHRLLAGVGLLLLLSAAQTAEIRVMTWNIEGGDASPEVIAQRVGQALAEVGPVAVLVLQELVEQEQVEAAAGAGGFRHWAMSDFSPPVHITGAWHKSLEVAILSRLPIEAVAEWDTTGPRPDGDRYPPRTSAPGRPTDSLRLKQDTGDPPPARGFLRVDLANGWRIYGVHWKSSGGQDCTAEDRESARVREIQAAGLAADAADALDQGRTLMIAGDFNIQAPGRVLRVGTDPQQDCAPTAGICQGICGPGGRDGYDDSIALLLGIGSSARLLSDALDSTYVLRRFPGGAIDHILVAGPQAAGFSAATTPPVNGKRWHGADHRPVLTRWNDDR